MRYIVNHDLHIHSQLSSCSRDPEQTAARILDYAVQNSFTDICLTDHFWDPAVPGASSWYAKQDYNHVIQSLPLPKAEGVNFHFGCETEMDKHMTLAISDKMIDKFDFVIVPINHFHMRDFTIDEKDLAPERRADTFVAHVMKLLNMDLPFHKMGIAHMCASSIAGTCDESIRDHLGMFDLISDDTFREIFELAAKRGVGIELNISAEVFEKYTPEETEKRFRMFKIAKKCGCKFYLGSDAHHPASFGKSLLRFNGAIDALGLEESDKFDFGSIKKA